MGGGYNMGDARSPFSYYVPTTGSDGCSPENAFADRWGNKYFGGKNAPRSPMAENPFSTVLQQRGSSARDRALPRRSPTEIPVIEVPISFLDSEGSRDGPAVDISSQNSLSAGATGSGDVAKSVHDIASASQQSSPVTSRGGLSDKASAAASSGASGVEKASAPQLAATERKPVDEQLAATKLQAAVRGFLVRCSKPLKQLKIVAQVKSDLEVVRSQLVDVEKMNKVRNDAKEKIRVSERLLSLLLRLDTVQGSHVAAVKNFRKATARQIVALMDSLDAPAANETVGEAQEEEYATPNADADDENRADIKVDLSSVEFNCAAKGSETILAAEDNSTEAETPTQNVSEAAAKGKDDEVAFEVAGGPLTSDVEVVPKVEGLGTSDAEVTSEMEGGPVTRFDEETEGAVSEKDSGEAMEEGKAETSSEGKRIEGVDVEKLAGAGVADEVKAAHQEMQVCKSETNIAGELVALNELADVEVDGTADAAAAEQVALEAEVERLERSENVEEIQRMEAGLAATAERLSDDGVEGWGAAGAPEDLSQNSQHAGKGNGVAAFAGSPLALGDGIAEAVSSLTESPVAGAAAYPEQEMLGASNTSDVPLQPPPSVNDSEDGASVAALNDAEPSDSHEKSRESAFKHEGPSAAAGLSELNQDVRLPDTSSFCVDRPDVFPDGLEGHTGLESRGGVVTQEPEPAEADIGCGSLPVGSAGNVALEEASEGEFASSSGSSDGQQNTLNESALPDEVEKAMEALKDGVAHCGSMPAALSEASLTETVVAEAGMGDERSPERKGERLEPRSKGASAEKDLEQNVSLGGEGVEREEEHAEGQPTCDDEAAQGAHSRPEMVVRGAAGDGAAISDSTQNGEAASSAVADESASGEGEPAAESQVTASPLQEPKQRDGSDEVVVSASSQETEEDTGGLGSGPADVVVEAAQKKSAEEGARQVESLQQAEQEDGSGRRGEALNVSVSSMHEGSGSDAPQTGSVDKAVISSSSLEVKEDTGAEGSRPADEVIVKAAERKLAEEAAMQMQKEKAERKASKPPNKSAPTVKAAPPKLPPLKKGFLLGEHRAPAPGKRKLSSPADPSALKSSLKKIVSSSSSSSDSSDTFSNSLSEPDTPPSPLSSGSRSPPVHQNSQFTSRDSDTCLPYKLPPEPHHSPLVKPANPTSAELTSAELKSAPDSSTSSQVVEELRKQNDYLRQLLEQQSALRAKELELASRQVAMMQSLQDRLYSLENTIRLSPPSSNSTIPHQTHRFHASPSHSRGETESCLPPDRAPFGYGAPVEEGRHYAPDTAANPSIRKTPVDFQQWSGSPGRRSGSKANGVREDNKSPAFRRVPPWMPSAKLQGMPLTSRQWKCEPENRAHNSPLLKTPQRAADDQKRHLNGGSAGDPSCFGEVEDVFGLGSQQALPIRQCGGFCKEGSTLCR